jgi:hypothetical protein
VLGALTSINQPDSVTDETRSVTSEHVTLKAPPGWAVLFGGASGGVPSDAVILLKII